MFTYLNTQECILRMASKLNGGKLICRKQWIDVLGNHVQLPITIVDKRKNRFNPSYKVMVVRKGQILYQNVHLGEWCNYRHLNKTESIYLSLIFMKLDI